MGSVDKASGAGRARALRVPILAYHWLVPKDERPAHRFEISQATLRKHLRLLKGAGFTPYDLERLPSALKGETSLPKRPFSITFDDGTEDLFTLGQPVLSEASVPATVFLVASRVGTTYDWDARLGVEPRPLLGWSQLKEMAAQGWSIGAHSMTHPDLTRLDREAATREIRNAKTLIEDRLGRAVTLFAYPYGRCNPALKRITAEAGYAAAFSMQTGPGDLFPSDLFALKRALIKGTEGRVRFALRLICASVRHLPRLPARGLPE